MNAVLIATLAAILGVNDPKGDLPKNLKGHSILGKWISVSAKTMGKSIYVEILSFEFSAEGKLKIAHSKIGRSNIASYTLDDQKNPKQIDFEMLDEERGNEKYVFWGIYKIDKDILTLCFCDDPTGLRPTEFVFKKLGFIVLKTFRRAELKN